MSTTTTSPEEDYITLYHRAFAEYGTIALWNRRVMPNPTREDALAITYSLRVEGDLRARWLAERIEEACHAAH